MPTVPTTQGTVYRTGSSVASDDLRDTNAVADTIGAIGTAAAPAAAAQAVGLVAVSGRVYKVRVIINLTGTTETALTNLALRQNAVVISSLPTISGTTQVIEVPRVTATGTTITVTVTATATAGSVYTVQIMATQVE